MKKKISCTVCPWERPAKKGEENSLYHCPECGSEANFVLIMVSPLKKILRLEDDHGKA